MTKNNQLVISILFFSAITLAFIIFAFVITVGIYPWPTFNQITNKLCTQEAKLCPDGSSVGRTDPNCEFAECPITDKKLEICKYKCDGKADNFCLKSNCYLSNCSNESKRCPDGTFVQRTDPNCQFASCNRPCKNICGDGICQTHTCDLPGCACRETKESCPQDCHKIDASIQKTYRNEEYSFELKYPKAFDDYGFKVIEDKGEPTNQIAFDFNLSTKEPPADERIAGEVYDEYSPIFTIYIWKKDDWDKCGVDCRFLAKLGEQNNLVYSYSHFQDYPQDINEVMLRADLSAEQILSTFKFIK